MRTLLVLSLIIQQVIRRSLYEVWHKIIFAWESPYEYMHQYHKKSTTSKELNTTTCIQLLWYVYLCLLVIS